MGAQELTLGAGGNCGRGSYCVLHRLVRTDTEFGGCPERIGGSLIIKGFEDIRISFISVPMSLTIVSP